MRGKRPVYDAMADRRVVKLRPVPQEPCRRHEEPASVRRAHFNQGVRGAEAGRRSNPLRMCPFGAAFGRAQCSILPFQYPWAAVRRAQYSILCSRSRIRGLEPSRFLGRETLGKPDNDLSITPHLSVGKGSGPPRPKCSIQFSSVQKNFSLVQIKLATAVRTPRAATYATGRG